MSLVLCSFALLGLGIGLVCPSMHGGMGGIGSNGSAYAEGAETQYTDGGMSVSLKLDDPDEDTLVRQSELGTVNYISKGFSISTSNVDEYSIYVQTAPGASNKLTNGNLTIDFVKQANTPTTSFGDNEWGYALSESGTLPENLSYSPVPDTGTTINPAYSTTDTTDDKSFTLNFAAKFGSQATAGHYTSSVILSVAAGAEDVVTLNNITYMQEMTSEICNTIPAPSADDIKNKSYAEIIAATPSKQLIDKRDNKYYWVSKLADGNCWMTQNLDFDIPAALYREDSDVLIDTLTGTSRVNAPTSWPQNNDNFKYNAYYDPGDYMYNGPDDNHGQGTTCTNATGPGGCDQFDVAVANIDASGNTNNHYHVGNYYSFSAATVKSADNLTSGSVPSSICPKGWKLPTITTGTTGEFVELLTKYGVNRSPTSGDYTIYSRPLYFVYGGGLYSGRLYEAGYRGYLWSSVPSSTTAALYLQFYSDVVNADGSFGRYLGLPVRCIAE